MGRLIGGIAVGATIAVLVVIGTTYVDATLYVGTDRVIEATDPYRMHRTFLAMPMMFHIATAVLVYYVAVGSVLIDRYARSISSPLAKALVLSVTAWLGLAGWAMSEGRSLWFSLFRSGVDLALPLFLGGFAMLRIMSSNTSLERTREG